MQLVMAQKQPILERDESRSCKPFPSILKRPRLYVDDLLPEVFCRILELSLRDLGVAGHERKRELASAPSQVKKGNSRCSSVLESGLASSYFRGAISRCWPLT